MKKTVSRIVSIFILTLITVTLLLNNVHAINEDIISEDSFEPGVVIVILDSDNNVFNNKLYNNDNSLNSNYITDNVSFTKVRSLMKIKETEKEIELYDSKDSENDDVCEIAAVYLESDEPSDVLKAIDSLKLMPGVIYAGPNFKYHANSLPNDTMFLNENNYWGMSSVKAPEAWNITTGESEIVVGILDDGIDYNHEDLKDNIWENPSPINGDIHGWNFVDNNHELSGGHGTHVAGTIGAKGNNGIGVAGVCWDVKLAALKVLKNNKGNTESLVAALNYAKEKEFPILNASIGSYEYDYAVEEAIKNYPGLLVVASGNEDFDLDGAYPTDNYYPAQYKLDNMIVVTSFDYYGDEVGSANKGKNTVHLFAPGGSYEGEKQYTGIYSTLPNDTYGYSTGTSMATPHVTGAAALILSAYPNLSTSELKERILANVDKDSKYYGSCITGGKLNIYKALTSQNFELDLSNEVITGFSPLLSYEYYIDGSSVIDYKPINLSNGNFDISELISTEQDVKIYVRTHMLNEEPMESVEFILPQRREVPMSPYIVFNGKTAELCGLSEGMEYSNSETGTWIKATENKIDIPLPENNIIFYVRFAGDDNNSPSQIKALGIYRAGI